jgi:hypothetical protein
MSVGHYLGKDALSRASMLEAMKAADVARRIQDQMPATLMGDMARSMTSQFPRTLTESVALGIQERLALEPIGALAVASRQLAEQHFSGTSSIMSSALEALNQRLTAEMARSRASVTASLAASAHLTARDALGTGALAGLGRIELNSLRIHQDLLRKGDLIGASTRAEIGRMAEMLAGPSLRVTQATQSAQLAEAMRDSLGGSWHGALNKQLIARAQAALEIELAADPERSLLETILAAVSRLAEFADHPNANNMATWIVALCTLLFTVVMADAQDQDNKDAAADSMWTSHLVMAKQDRILERLATKSLNHGTRLWARPDSGSKVLGQLAAETPVLAQERKGKWTQVSLRAAESPTGAPMSGWMLNKYLR